MSFLYPLFLAGITAVGLPIVLHMIRRHTRKRVTFSSLMFLRTTLPRFKSRSRLENLPLLALRCASLILLAFGFSRPFFWRPAPESQVHLGRRMVLLIDTSASMRRAGMWTQVISQAQSILEGLSQADRVCVMSFDQSPQTLIGFEGWAQNPAITMAGAPPHSDGGVNPQRASIVSEHISKLSPGWASTDLGRALVAAAEAIEDDEVNDGQESMAVRQVVIIGDMQQGSSLETLSTYEWPEDMELVVKLIRCQDPTNASLQLVTNPSDSWHGLPARGSTAKMAVPRHLVGPDGNDSPGIRITNSPEAAKELFSLNWADGPASGGTDVYVPAGHSIVVRIPTPKDRLATPPCDGGVNRLALPVPGRVILTGDDHDFDNTLYLAPHLQQQVNILYIGSDDADDSGGMLYYVRRACGATRALNARIIPINRDALADTDLPDRQAGISTAHLIIAADAIERQHVPVLRRYLESGGTVLLVMKSPDAATTVAGLAGIETIESEEANVDKYAMLSQIEFKHPLLTCFGEPRFGDFTRIAFWKYRRINIDDLPGASVLAWFDSGDSHAGRNDPAWFELHVGKGTLLVFTSGWHPSDSQLALSSKFVPLLYSILEYAGVLTEQQSQYFIGDNVPIPHPLRLESANLKVRKPDDSLISLDADQRTFAQTNLPGIYAIESATGSGAAGPAPSAVQGSARGRFAVNLPAKESQTAVMQIEDLERFGVSLSRESGAAKPPLWHGLAARENTAKMAVPRGLEYEPRHSDGGVNRLALPEPGRVFLWRWVFIALLAVSLIEIWLAGWMTGQPSISQGEQK